MAVKITNSNQKVDTTNIPKKQNTRTHDAFKQVFDNTINNGVKKLNQPSDEKLIGQITNKNPTVSHVLLRDPKFGSACWDIIHSQVNKNKPFTHIPPGTNIYIDPESLELSWTCLTYKGDKGSAEAVNSEQLPFGDKTTKRLKLPLPAGLNQTQQNYLNRNLTQNIGAYLGKTYEEMDCYELIVNCLSDIGIDYHEKGGLRDYLIKMGMEQGSGKYAFFNGEGIVKAIGDTAYSKRTDPHIAVETELESIMSGLKSVLEEGQILSFSTRQRGHTGIVSKSDGGWAFINSGIMDHATSKGGVGKGVGKEYLKDEVLNWLRLAHRKGQSLLITLGSLNAAKAAQFRPMNKVSDLFA